MRRIRSFFTLSLALLLASLARAEKPDEPYKFFREFAGLKEEQIAAIRLGKAIAKTVESRTPDEVFVFGAVYVEATPESYLKLASDLDALRELPNYLAIQSFSMPSLRNNSMPATTFKTALDLTICVKDAQRPGFYLITLEGSKQAGLTGPKGAIIRKVATDKTRSSLERVLVTIRQKLESQYFMLLLVVPALIMMFLGRGGDAAPGKTEEAPEESR